MPEFEFDLSGDGVLEGEAVLTGDMWEHSKGTKYKLEANRKTRDYLEYRTHEIEQRSVIPKHAPKDYFSIERVVGDQVIDPVHLREMHPAVQTKKFHRPRIPEIVSINLYPQDMNIISNKEEREIYIRSERGNASDTPHVEGAIKRDGESTTYLLEGQRRLKSSDRYMDAVLENLGLPTTDELREQAAKDTAVKA